MKKLVSLLCAAMLCVCCVSLVACGGSAASSSAAAEASSAAADPAANFIGTWKLAAAEMQGVTVTGDLSAVMGTSFNMEFTFNEDGTGSTSMNENSSDLTWELKGENAITVTPAATSDSADAADASAEAASVTEAISEGTPLDFTLSDGVLSATMDANGQTATMMLTKDGTLPNTPQIDTANATPITSEADLIGTWNLCGMNIMGVTMYGDSEAIAAATGGTDTSMTFEEGGICTAGGQAVKYTVDSDGAAIVEGDVKVPLLMLDGNIVFDIGSLTGSGTTMIAMYSK